MRKQLSISLILGILLLLFIVASKSASSTIAAPATHVVISEIQIADSASSNSADFVELYNPTNSPVNLGDMRLAKRTSTGTTDTNIIAFTQEHIIPAHGYFLWCNTVIDVTLNCDANSSGTISEDNSVVLRQDPAETGVIIDAVTIGTPANPVGEGVATENPGDGASVERKANSSSTVPSMTTGADMLLGNAEDSNNNASDFITRSTSQSQNTTSNTEPQGGVTPSATPSVSPSITVAPTISTTPTPTSTTTPTPTSSPTVTPTKTPTPTPTTPAVTTTPMVTPTPTVKPPVSRITFQLVCTEKIKTYRVLGMEFHISYPTCKVIRS